MPADTFQPPDWVVSAFITKSLLRRALAVSSVLSLVLLLSVSFQNSDNAMRFVVDESGSRLHARSLLNSVPVAFRSIRPTSVYQSLVRCALQEGNTSVLAVSSADCAHGLGRSTYTYVGCILYASNKLSRSHFRSASLRISQCLVFCDNAGFYYAALVAGNMCHCSLWTGNGIMRVNGQCAARCSGESRERCGGGTYADVYHVRSPDGVHDWSPWMGVSKRKGAAPQYCARFRHCRLPEVGPQLCKPTIAKKKSITIPAHGQKEYFNFVGCFVFGREPKALKLDDVSDAQSCIARCGDIAKTYALFDFPTPRCLCSDSLGVARPFSHCGLWLPGVAVYFTNVSARDGTQVHLTFDLRPRQKRVALIMHTPPTTTLLSEMLRDDKRALHVVEPFAIFDDQLQSEDNVNTRRVHAAYHRITDLHFACDVFKLPARWMTLSEAGTTKQQLSMTGFDRYNNCTETHGAQSCLPVVQTACEAATILSTATAQLRTASAVYDLHHRYKESIIIHIIRDPVYIFNAMKKNQGLKADAQNAKWLCARLTTMRAAVAAVAKLGHRAYNTHYEDFEDEPMEMAARVYDNMLLAPLSPKERKRILDFIRLRVSSTLTDGEAVGIAAKPQSASNPRFAVASKHSKTMPTRAMSDLTPEEVELVEKECANFIYDE